MPIYEYSCEEHGPFEVYGDYSHAKGEQCPKCRKVARRKFSPAKAVVDFRPGWFEAFGRWVDTKRERDNLAAERGLMREP